MMLGEIHRQSRKVIKKIPKTPDYRQVVLEIQAAMEFVEKVATKNRTGYSDEKKSSFAHRKYTMADARQDARTGMLHLRKAWELLDPVASPPMDEEKREAAFESGLESLARACKKSTP